MEFHTHDTEAVRFRYRVIVAALFILTCFMLLVGRFYYLQVVRHEYYHTRAEDNRIALLPVVPSRGAIVDRNGVVLAHNYAAYTLEITPSQVEGDLDAVIDELSSLVLIEARDRRRFRKAMEEGRNFKSAPIRTRLSDEEIARFIAQRYRFPGVEVQARLFREYPQGTTASHVIGYIGRINERDQERIEERGDISNYRGSDYIGKSGLEQSYEADLHGTTGFEQVEVNAGGRAVRRLARTGAISGHNLQLTLDVELQKIAEAAFGDRRGALVAIEPSTGGVLALVSTPTFDPNLFVEGITTQDWRALNDSPDLPLLNRAIYSAYPPGSTFKPFMALAGLATGKRTATQVMIDPGFFVYSGHRFMDDKVGGHGIVDMHKSIVVSCNTYYYQLAADLGIDAIAGFMSQLGFGSRTGIDIPGEAEGVLPSPEWKKKRFRRPEQQRWFGGETISVGIGQGYNAYTPLQLASALATVLNDGRMYRPHIVRSVVDVHGKTVREIEPEPLRELSFKPEHLAVIRNAMVDTVKVGTGARAFAGAAYQAGGKTGTAQVFSLKGSKYVADKLNERLRDHSLFIAYAPAEQPKIALAILVENGGFGARSAAPIARQVMDFYLLGRRAGGAVPDDEGAVDEEHGEEEGHAHEETPAP